MGTGCMGQGMHVDGVGCVQDCVRNQQVIDRAGFDACAIRLYIRSFMPFVWVCSKTGFGSDFRACTPCVHEVTRSSSKAADRVVMQVQVSNAIDADL